MINPVYLRKFFLSFILFFFFALISFSNEKNDPQIEKYNQEKITLEVKKSFDVLYPLDKKLFYFNKGGEKLTFKQFIELTKDPVLLKYQEKINKIKLAGFATGLVCGISTIAFLIPSVIFVVKMTSYNMLDYAYTITGVGMVGMTFLSGLITLIDCIVTFALLYKYKFNEYTVKQAIDRYNENLEKKLGIMPDLSFNSNEIKIGFFAKL